MSTRCTVLSHCGPPIQQVPVDLPRVYLRALLVRFVLNTSLEPAPRNPFSHRTTLDNPPPVANREPSRNVLLLLPSSHLFVFPLPWTTGSCVPAETCPNRKVTPLSAAGDAPGFGGAPSSGCPQALEWYECRRLCSCPRTQAEGSLPSAEVRRGQGLCVMSKSCLRAPGDVPWSVGRNHFQRPAGGWCAVRQTFS